MIAEILKTLAMFFFIGFVTLAGFLWFSCAIDRADEKFGDWIRRGKP